MKRRGTAKDSTASVNRKTDRQMVLDAFRKANIPHPEERTLLFLAKGMLCNIAAALDMPELMEK